MRKDTNEFVIELLRTNANTEYGRLHQFESITSPKQFQKHVPLTTYDDYTEYIERIGEGQPSILTSDPVLMFELSSGSVAASKSSHTLTASKQNSSAALTHGFTISTPTSPNCNAVPRIGPSRRSWMANALHRAAFLSASNRTAPILGCSANYWSIR